MRVKAAKEFLESLFDENTGAYRSTIGGMPTLYGTCYASLAIQYLDKDWKPHQQSVAFMQNSQCPVTGSFIGPELFDYNPVNSTHDREHLILHSTCAALGALQHFQIPILHALHAAHDFCDQNFLINWLNDRDLSDAWLEGNNLLFVGQLLVYLRDCEQFSGAEQALQTWFSWLDANLDPATSLWGTDRGCQLGPAIYGGYHQLLVYYYENHGLANPKGLIDCVLSIQHSDGGFDIHGNAGACEDVDAVDILVNLYKRHDYRRAEIRNSLRRCADHILATQNADGGFPYKRDHPQNHMGIPGTNAVPNVSTTFPTWFRVHTLALCAEILPDHRILQLEQFSFSKHLSMGWHQNPANFSFAINRAQRRRETYYRLQANTRETYRYSRSKIVKIARRLKLLQPKIW